MRFSRLVCVPQKSAKAFESVNATLLTRAGFIHQTMAGAYTLLPLGLRVLNKIEQIVREEMDKLAAELVMTALSPKSLWQTTGRLDTVDVLMQTIPANAAAAAKHRAEYVLNSTQEELITPIVQEYATSYKQLPAALYQIQTKFRNEPRAKSGLLRGREFRMKDLYSFHKDEADLKRYYEEVKQGYVRVFERVGLGKQTVIALASGGDFTKDYSHEFQTRCATGEDLIFYSKSQDLYYNREVTPSIAPQVHSKTAAAKLEKVYGENITGMAALVEFLKLPANQCVKTMIYQAASGQVWAAAVRGDYDVHQEKLTKLVGEPVQLASAEVVERVTGAQLGYAGLIGLTEDVKILCDESIASLTNFECGGNETNYHLVNVNWERDLPKPAKFVDIKVAKEGDLDTQGEPYEVFRACEVGNIFPLNTKFSSAFGYCYIDETGQQQPVFMGSYGIGTSRLIGVIAEVMHDERGLTWPMSIAPYQVHLVSLNGGEAAADQLYQQLQTAGIEVIYDDRDLSAGTKLADADLVGIPVRLVCSAKTGTQVEWKGRQSSATELLSAESVIKKLRSTAQSA